MTTISHFVFFGKIQNGSRPTRGCCCRKRLQISGFGSSRVRSISARDHLTDLFLSQSLLSPTHTQVGGPPDSMVARSHRCQNLLKVCTHKHSLTCLIDGNLLLRHSFSPLYSRQLLRWRSDDGSLKKSASPQPLSNVECRLTPSDIADPHSRNDRIVILALSNLNQGVCP